jgi:hypothetical protein
LFQSWRVRHQKLCRHDFQLGLSCSWTIMFDHELGNRVFMDFKNEFSVSWINL